MVPRNRELLIQRKVEEAERTRAKAVLKVLRGFELNLDHVRLRLELRKLRQTEIAR